MTSTARIGTDLPAVRATWRVRPIALGAVALAVAYYLGAGIGFALTPSPQPVSTLWPPNAILLGALLLAPPRAWPVLLVAVLPAHLLVELRQGVPFLMVLSWFVSNCTEALIGAAGIRWLSDQPTRLDTFRRVTIFVAVGAIAAPLLSSFLDAAFVRWNAWGAGTFWEVWRVRFFSNVLAILALVPVIITFGNATLARKTIPPGRALEATVLVGGLLVASAALFSGLWQGFHPSPLIFAPLPLLIWAAVRFGPGGTSLCFLIVALFSIWGAINGQGPFVSDSMRQSVLQLQLFLILTDIPLLALAAVISEQAHDRQVIRNSEERFRLAMSAAQMGTWDWDIDQDRLMCSGDAAAVLGLDDGAGRIDYRAFVEMLDPADRTAVASAVSQALERGGMYTVEFRIRARDGSTRWVLAKGTVRLDPKGKPGRLIGVTIDITERKLAEQARRDELRVRESEARLRELADAMPQIVFAATADGRIDYFNRKWYEFTRDGEGGPDWISLLHPDDRAPFTAEWSVSVRDGRPFEYEGRLWSAAARAYRWHLVRALPLRNEDGGIGHWYGTATDIDDQKRVEQALRESEIELRAFGEELEQRVAVRTAELTLANDSLREEIEHRVQIERALRASEERFAKAFSASPDAIAIARPPDLRLIEVNDRWEVLFGYPRADVLGRTFEDLEIIAQQSDREWLMAIGTSQESMREIEIDLRHRYGAHLTGVIAVEPVEVEGEPCLIVMIRDVTERRRAEHVMDMQRRQLAHLGRVALLGELSGALAHELNQPLAAILANANAASRMLAAGNDDTGELRAIIADIVADDKRAGAVIRRLRALIRRGEAELQPVALNEIVSDVLELARSDLIERRVSVEIDLTTLSTMVLADRVQLQQVMLNLIVNACDAMSSAPPPARCIEIGTSAGTEGVHLRVIDCGVGMSPDNLESVFEPFVSTKEHGLGLGLAICRSIVDAHGGRMWASNNQNGGATFHVLLPHARAQANAVA